MTEDQIKAIAREVAHLRAFDGGHFPHEKEIREDYEVLLQWLNDRYCIVERAKVMEMYNSLKTPNHPCVDPKPTGVARIVLADLFGTSMFNQDEIEK